jgi:23S rRNA (guanine745-N1)-methyltransferase
MSPPSPLVLACPHCAQALLCEENSALCENGHSFDRAREGYFNLLVGGRIPATVTPGDTPDALAARRRFFSHGGYRPIAEALAAAVGEVDGALLDIGCGEGFYLSHCVAHSRFGLDVSKRAVQMASRLIPDAQLVVGSAYRLPILNQSCETVFSVFAPRPFDEFIRVLQPGGHWFTVTPGPAHLAQMRPMLEGDAGEKAREREQRRGEPPPEATDAHRIEFVLELNEETAHDLFMMTPLQWQANASDASINSLREVNIDVWLSTGSIPT